MTTDSIITRCPKCATAFRVTHDVLKMASGKVRCGQCFHIFVANAAQADSKPLNEAKTADTKSRPVQQKQSLNKPDSNLDQTAQSQPKPNRSQVIFTAADEPPVDPKWLDELFDEEDLAPISKHQSKEPTSKNNDTHNTNADPAPWEVELAELESSMREETQAAPKSATKKASPPASKPAPSTPQKKAEAVPATPKPTVHETPPEPDYMLALHALAQDVSDQNSNQPSQQKARESLLNLTAENSLASLVKEDPPAPKKKSWWWMPLSLIALFGLIIQLGVTYFDIGSRSNQLRPLYKLACTYIGCTLPTFERVSDVDIQHTRIQSHPTLPNALVVNAIMTNTSNFAQPMPKIALEFYDLNGNPVAARLFAPNDYLHKDFLDITYMPPSTPIHVVINIHDPGARAVTHQLKVFPANTRSY